MSYTIHEFLKLQDSLKPDSELLEEEYLMFRLRQRRSREQKFKRERKDQFLNLTD